MIKKSIKELYEIYDDGYQFPEWSFEIDSKLFKKSKVYYDDISDPKVVRKVVEEREPVNIAMRRHYNLSQMKKVFGWRTGYYGEYYEKKGKLAPNIAVYCQTPVGSADGELIHVINSIGLAFDDQRQPDYQCLIKDQSNVECVGMIYSEIIFPKIYQCAQDHGLTTVVMSLVGANNFAYLYEDKKLGLEGVYDFQVSVWNRALYDFLTKVENKSLVKGIKTVFMGAKDSASFRNLPELFSKSELGKYFKLRGGQMIDIGFFPANVGSVNVKKTLFVNAWDPWSFAGNGNEMDNSLDGFIGRNTAIAVLSSPLTNRFLENTKAYVEV